jgi:hypothetical protein
MLTSNNKLTREIRNKMLSYLTSVLSLVLFVGMCLYKFQRMFINPNMPVADVWKTTFGTGDIIAFNCSPGIALATSAWTHVGLIIRIQGVPFVVEILPENTYPTVTPLAVRLIETLERPDWAAAVRSCRRDVDDNDVARAALKFRRYQYEHSYWIPLLNRMAVWLPIPDRPSTNFTYCTDLIVRMSHDLGLVDNDRPVFPGDIVSDSWNPKTWGPPTRLLHMPVKSSPYRSSADARAHSITT